jgi:elongation factor 4
VPDKVVTGVGVEANTAAQPPGVTRLLARYAAIPPDRVRNFSVIAHIDHGKSTLADKLLEATGNIWPTVKGRQQVLDSLEVERSRGITVKAQTASMIYVNPADGLEYLLNLIDTPGHVDFSYEVARSLAACEGALLLVDATQGVQAQTVSNHNAAADAGLTIVPVLTKIDLPTADPEPALAAMEAAFGVAMDDVLWTSAKTGAGVAEIFPAILARIKAPGVAADRAAPLRCLLLDSWYDEYRGVICTVQVVGGSLRAGDAIVSAHTGDRFHVQEVGLIAPAKVPVPPGAALSAGHIGYMVAGIKNTRQR